MNIQTMPLILQAIILANGVAAVIFGGLITPLIFWSKGRKPSSGFFAGVLAGAIGNLIVLIPLWIMLKRKKSGAISPVEVTTAYNMGVAAVLGNRMEEARYYFVQTTQLEPRHTGAWLYLANVATTPLEAWSYVQQARAIDPQDALVQEAVSIVWPQVRHLYGEGEAPPAAEAAR